MQAQTQKQTVRNRIRTKFFQLVHRNNLVYNICWEDPALDRIALNFEPSDRVLVITSAGCNALDYVLAGAGEVNAIDVNPIQNSLLELKVAGIKRLSFDTYFEFFGQGCCKNARSVYKEQLRDILSPVAQKYWDRNIGFFEGRGWRKSFYYHGTSGLLAKLALTNMHLLHRLRKPIDEILNAKSVEEQRQIYDEKIRPRIWTPWLRWFLSRSATLSLAGVPWPQTNEIISQYPGGVAKFVRDALEAVVTELPFQNNYFWRVYIQGHFTRDCCPEYLRQENFQKLKSGLVDRLHIHTGTVTEFLKRITPGISKFILLDHMDWMSYYHPDALIEEWNAILEKARPGARAIFRSAGLKVQYLDNLKVQHRGQERRLGDLLTYHEELATRLHKIDRVHTYGSFYIAELPE